MSRDLTPTVSTSDNGSKSDKNKTTNKPYEVQPTFRGPNWTSKEILFLNEKFFACIVRAGRILRPSWSGAARPGEILLEYDFLLIHV